MFMRIKSKIYIYILYPFLGKIPVQQLRPFSIVKIETRHDKMCDTNSVQLVCRKRRKLYECRYVDIITTKL